MHHMAEMMRFLESRGQSAAEGSSSPPQQDYLRQLVRRSRARLVGEVGFNAGFSSLAFLNADPGVRVVSFDIGQHDIVRHAKDFIDELYPGRHELIIGDSTLTVPRYAAENPAASFDLVFIDGGHTYETVAADIVNMRAISHLGTCVVVDDLTPWLWWGEGPARAWTQAVSEERIIEVEIFKDGQRVPAIAPPGERSWGLGFYR
jgi:predicted O-methyltransferase YrrM